MRLIELSIDMYPAGNTKHQIKIVFKVKENKKKVFYSFLHQVFDFERRMKNKFTKSDGIINTITNKMHGNKVYGDTTDA